MTYRTSFAVNIGLLSLILFLIALSLTSLFMVVTGIVAVLKACLKFWGWA